MAVIKAVPSKAPIGSVIDYVEKHEKTEKKLLSGYNLSSVPTAKDEMQATKRLWGKLGGRTYKHFVQSFHKDEKITPAQAHEIAKEFVGKCKLFDGFEVLIATHKDREHIHTHFILNSVSFKDGHKFQMSKNDLQDMKALSDKLCAEKGLSITQKGKTYEGEDRIETSAYAKETYRLLKKAEKGDVKSYVQDIALAVLDCMEQATGQADFIEMMNERGYGVDWKENHKYITFIDLERQLKGEKQCKIRNNKLENYYNLKFGKEDFKREFEANTRKQAEKRRISGAIKRGQAAVADTVSGEIDGSKSAVESSKSTEGQDDIEAFVQDISVRVGNAEAGRKEREAERERQRAEERRKAEERSRQQAEERRRAEQAKQERAARPKQKGGFSR